MINKPNLLESHISQLFRNETDPREKSPSRLHHLCDNPHHGLLCIDSPSQLLTQFLPQEQVQVTDFTQTCVTGSLSCVTKAWHNLCNSRPQQTVLIFFPRLEDADARRLFGDIRADMMAWALNGQSPLHMILCVDYVTYLQMAKEDPHAPKESPLAKELASNTWYLEGLDVLDPVIQWLSGGDSVAINFLFQRLQKATWENEAQWQWAVYRSVHELAWALCQEKTPESWRDRLLHALPNTMQYHPHIFAQYQDELTEVQPGRYAHDDAESPQKWHKMRHHARWRTYTELRPTQKALLLNGFLRYEATEAGTYLRLRHPLLAWSLNFCCKTIADKKAASRTIQYALTRPNPNWLTGKKFEPKKIVAHSLDYYLDVLLDKALDLDDEEADHWTVAKWPMPERLKPKVNKGEWWKRLTLVAL
jgi:hypothetical protein